MTLSTNATPVELDSTDSNKVVVLSSTRVVFVSSKVNCATCIAVEPNLTLETLLGACWGVVSSLASNGRSHAEVRAFVASCTDRAIARSHGTSASFEGAFRTHHRFYC